MSHDKKRTFSHYETKYFSNWYFRQNPPKQKKFVVLLNGGQFEFVNGGWEMHDEACPTYQDMLVNL